MSRRPRRELEAASAGSVQLGQDAGVIGGPHPADWLGADPADRADMAAPALVG
jgi:hypothetical protein